MGKQFEVWIGNLGKYVEGYLEGTWLSFPATKESINQALDKIGIGKGYEEIIVEDIDMLGHAAYLNDIFGEYSNLNDLNMIAHLMSRLSEDEMQLAEFFVVAQESKMNIEEFGNLLLQTDAVPYHPFSFPGINEMEEMSGEEKYGYSVTYDSGAYEKLKEIGLNGYVNYEDIGRDANLSGYVVFFSEGYIDCRALGQVQLDLYSRNELYAEAGLEIGERQIKSEQSLQEEQEIDRDMFSKNKNTDLSAKSMVPEKQKPKELPPVL